MLLPPIYIQIYRVTLKKFMEGVAKLALEPKFESRLCWARCGNWHTLEGSRFTNGPSKWQKREFWPKWSFANSLYDSGFEKKGFQVSSSHL